MSWWAQEGVFSYQARGRDVRGGGCVYQSGGTFKSSLHLLLEVLNKAPELLVLLNLHIGDPNAVAALDSSATRRVMGLLRDPPARAQSPAPPGGPAVQRRTRSASAVSQQPGEQQAHQADGERACAARLQRRVVPLHPAVPEPATTTSVHGSGQLAALAHQGLPGVSGGSRHDTASVPAVCGACYAPDAASVGRWDGAGPRWGRLTALPSTLCAPGL